MNVVPVEIYWIFTLHQRCSKNYILWFYRLVYIYYQIHVSIPENMSVLQILLRPDFNAFLVSSLVNELHKIFDVFLVHLSESLDFTSLSK